MKQTRQAREDILDRSISLELPADVSIAEPTRDRIHRIDASTRLPISSRILNNSRFGNDRFSREGIDFKSTDEFLVTISLSHSAYKDARVGSNVARIKIHRELALPSTKQDTRRRAKSSDYVTAITPARYHPLASVLIRDDHFASSREAHPHSYATPRLTVARTAFSRRPKIAPLRSYSTPFSRS